MFPFFEELSTLEKLVFLKAAGIISAEPELPAEY